ncbi:hypothetical protein DFJ73DRAFT_532984 [Zopfochytrium polystomum]|nr:hypothetical protein DFJ73DRAFT_532984 [Zopfochytrium polystomum]
MSSIRRKHNANGPVAGSGGYRPLSDGDGDNDIGEDALGHDLDSKELFLSTAPDFLQSRNPASRPTSHPTSPIERKVRRRLIRLFFAVVLVCLVPSVIFIVLYGVGKHAPTSTVTQSAVDRLGAVGGKAAVLNLTLNGECGPASGYSCWPGFCCSQWGYCGTSTDHCAKGCQVNYGECGTRNSTSSISSTSSIASTPTTSLPSTSSSSIGQASPGTSTSSGTTSPAVNSVTSVLESTYGVGGVCGSGKGLCYPGFCCSMHGYCGQDETYCGTGCQPAFGLCGADATAWLSTHSTATPTTNAVTSTTSAAFTGVANLNVTKDGQCGPSHGICNVGLCCNTWGWCGQDCSIAAGCNPTYGDCDGYPQIKGITVTYKCTVPGTVAITFDDGPFLYLGAVADQFTAAGGKTTFFINGNNADCLYDHMGDIVRAFNNGHQIASHTWSHPNMTAKSTSAQRNEIQKLENAIKNILGLRPNYFRPPFGEYNADLVNLLKNMNYTHVVLWDKTPQETSNGSDNSYPADAVNEKQTYLTADLSVPHIFLQHNLFNVTTYTMVPFILNWAKTNNLKMVTVAECLGDSNPYRDIGKPATPPAQGFTC